MTFREFDSKYWVHVRDRGDFFGAGLTGSDWFVKDDLMGDDDIRKF